MNPNHCHSRMRGPLDQPAAKAYRVAIRTWDKACVLCRKSGGTMQLTLAGRLVERCWREIPVHFGGVVPGAIVVLENQVEGLLLIPSDASNILPRSLDLVVGAFKSAVSACLGRSIWETGYEQHPLEDAGTISEGPPACVA